MLRNIIHFNVYNDIKVGQFHLNLHQGSPHLQKIGRLYFSLRDHKGEVKAWQGDFQQSHRDMFSQKLNIRSIIIIKQIQNMNMNLMFKYERY
jgi:hypothetical protein